MADVTRFSSSGDLTLDRRFEWARASLDAGDAETAAALLAEVAEAAPHWPAAWFHLASAREAAGVEDAGAALARYLALEPGDPLGGRGVLGAGALSAAFVQTLYDDYAPRFEEHLVGRLGYDGPALIVSALRAARAPLAFGTALDLGCGTGLMGRALAGFCGRLDGVDLSAQMLRRAAAAGVYATLAQADMTSWLAARPAGEAGLVVAADSFIYVADLAPTFHAARRALQPDGLFAFTVQSHDGQAESVLGPDARYAVSRAGLERLAAAAGFAALTLEPASTRRDRGVPTPGHIAVLRPMEPSA